MMDYNLLGAIVVGGELLCECGHKLGWHHAKMKSQGKTLICFGIACMCECFSPSLENGMSEK